MIKINKKIVDKLVTTTKSKEIEEYVCSDGKVFSNEYDYAGKYMTGLKEAEQHEYHLNKTQIAKNAISFKDFNNTYKHNGYYSNFCFYYDPEYTKEVKEYIQYLVFDINDKWFELKRKGWYYVEQDVNDSNSSSIGGGYDCDGDITYVEDLINDLEIKLKEYKEIING